MQRTFLAGCALAVAALSGGCGGSDPASPQITVTDLAAGAYTVAFGDAANPTVGKYYAGSNGERLLIVGDGDADAQTVYRRASASARWSAAPAAAADTAVVLLDSRAMLDTSVSSPSGSFVLPLPDGSVARIDIAAGVIAAGNTACKISGTVGAGPYPDALALNLSSSGCGSNVPPSASGILALDEDYAPVAFRIVADNGSTVVDLRAFAE